MEFFLSGFPTGWESEFGEILFFIEANFISRSFRKFEELSEKGEKVGEPSKALAAQFAAMQAEVEDTSCGYAEEGQDSKETSASDKTDKNEV